MTQFELRKKILDTLNENQARSREKAATLLAELFWPLVSSSQTIAVHTKSPIFREKVSWNTVHIMNGGLECEALASMPGSHFLDLVDSFDPLGGLDDA